MIKEDIIESIKNISALYKVDHNLCLAIAKTESEYSDTSCRYEKEWRYLKDPEVCVTQLVNRGFYTSLETEIQLQKMSHGVFQLMGSVMRELKYFDPILKIYSDPKIGIVLGIKKIKTLMDKYLDESDCISAYNAGSPRKILRNGVLEYSNQKYVDKVSILTELLRQRESQDG